MADRPSVADLGSEPSDPADGTDSLLDPAAERSVGPQTERVTAVVRRYLDDNGLAYDETKPRLFSFSLPGERKLQTAVRLDVGARMLGVHAFVCRRPDENREGVLAWLLAKNLRLYAIAFAIDRLGDIYLDSRLPLGGIDEDELDRVLGSVLTTADESFNTLLELGFRSSIRKEWQWRRLRGEPTHNLEAFRGWLEAEERLERSAPGPVGD